MITPFAQFIQACGDTICNGQRNVTARPVIDAGKVMTAYKQVSVSTTAFPTAASSRDNAVASIPSIRATSDPN